MAIAFQTSTYNYYSEASRSLTKPTGTALGDLLIAQLIFDDATPSGMGVSVTPPSGWTLIKMVENTTGSYPGSMFTYYKIATATEVSAGWFTFTTNAGYDGYACCIRISGHSTSSPIASSEIGTSYSGSYPNASVNVPTITPSRANNMLLMFYAGFSQMSGGANVTSWSIATSSPSFTEIWDEYDTGPNAGGAAAYALRPEDTESGTGLMRGYNYRPNSMAGIMVFVSPFSVPTVTTEAVSSIESTTATGNGTVVSDDGGAISERGVCWKTSSGPTTSDSKATSAGTTGAFTASMTGLSSNTTYYVRAYAINSAGTSYGSEVTFTTDTTPTVTTQNPSNIASTTVTGNGTVVSDGGSTISERGFCWALTANPTTSSSKVTVSGTTGSYSGTISSLTENTTYHFRAYAINSVGTSYGADIEFGTAGKPTVTTQAASSLDLTSAVLNGTVVSDNQYTITERGFCYKTSTGPTTSDTKVIVAGTTGAYYGSATGLANGTLYYVRAYAINSAGTSYGSEITFTTLTAGDKQLIKDIGATDGESYSVSITVGGSAGSVTVKLGTTGYSQVINAGAGVTVVTGEYAGLSGLIIESSEGFIGTVDDVYWVKLLGGTEVIDWNLDQYTSYIPIDSSVKFKRVEDKELTRFDLYRYLDAQFKDLDGYVTLTITEEANDKSQNRNKTFVVGNEIGVVSPFVKKRISMLSKNQAIVVQFSNAKLSETFTVCQYQLTGSREPRKLYKLSKIISI